MPRIRKEHHERRDELLDAAWELFTEQGWDKTTVQAVIDRVGVAKGTFYHYFRSQEELLDSMLERIAAQNLAAASRNLDDPTLASLDRLNRFFAQNVQWRIRNVRMIRQIVLLIYRPENRLVRQRLWTKSSRLAAPYLSEILRQGMAEGVMRVEDAEMTAELLLELGYLLGEANADVLLSDMPPEEKLTLMNRRFATYTTAMARMIGTDESGIQLPGKQLFEAVICEELSESEV